jgi:2-keto-4-pentenoate hydratase/2-oxohepta-3-ene-1,7-dioic acid hydratase in catechol pathway
MRFLSFDHNGSSCVGVMPDKSSDQFVDLSMLATGLPTELGALIGVPDGLQRAFDAAKTAPSQAHKSLKSVKFMPLIGSPSKIVCMGLNYADHAKEGGNARPDFPSFFLRGPTSLVAHREAIIRPKASTKLDYEAELALVIGKRARHLTSSNALECIAGYSCFNDGSVRDFQRKSSQWTLGKNFDATGGFGPYLVTPEELPSAADGLRIQSRLNGQVMQDGNTADFLWGVVESLCIISECMTLEPGDVIITGTPAGVGYARTPPVWMAPADVCEIDIEGVGVLSNTIADEV